MPKISLPQAFLAALVAIPLAGAPLAATHAEDEQAASGFSLGLSASTLGLGGEIGYRPHKTFGLRLGGNLFSIGRDETIDDITYQGDLKLKNAGLYADLYPFGGSFRLSGGLRYSDNKVAIEATPDSAVSVGDTVFTPSEIGTLNGDITVDDFSPYIGLGWGAPMGRGLSFSIDLGVVFQGSPKIDNLTADGSLANDPAFQAELAREEMKIEDDIDGFKYYPVLSLGLVYSF